MRNFINDWLSDGNYLVTFFFGGMALFLVGILGSMVGVSVMKYLALLGIILASTSGGVTMVWILVVLLIYLGLLAFGKTSDEADKYAKKWAEKFTHPFFAALICIGVMIYLFSDLAY